MNNLAVVIPAYKSKYFAKVLDSLAAQTNKHFTVYVGDDCSNEGIGVICDGFRDRLDIKYHRFEDNLGGKDLVAQWNRCCSLIAEEDWVWLFSDDDIAEPACVEVFYETLVRTAAFYDVYRFDTVTIDHEDKIVNISPENPEKEDHNSLAYHLLLGERGNSMPDHIFRRERLQRTGGFINFPFAQASDFASSIEFASPKGLYTMRGPKVRWRYSGDNISSTAHKIKDQAIFGYLAYIRWLSKKFNIGRRGASIEDVHHVDRALLVRNLTKIITTHYKGVPYPSFNRVVKEIAGIFEWSYIRAFYYCLRINSIIYYRRRRRTFKIAV